MGRKAAPTKEPELVSFGQRLASEIGRCKTTQTRLARLSGVDQGAISRLTRAEGGVTVANLVRLLGSMSTIGADVEYVITGQKRHQTIFLEGYGPVTGDHLVELLLRLREEQSGQEGRAPHKALAAHRHGNKP